MNVRERELRERALMLANSGRSIGEGLDSVMERAERFLAFLKAGDTEVTSTAGAEMASWPKDTDHAPELDPPEIDPERLVPRFGEND